jgi:hypothetical protein
VKNFVENTRSSSIARQPSSSTKNFFFPFLCWLATTTRWTGRIYPVRDCATLLGKIEIRRRFMMRWMRGIYEYEYIHYFDHCRLVDCLLPLHGGQLSTCSHDALFSCLHKIGDTATFLGSTIPIAPRTFNLHIHPKGNVLAYRHANKAAMPR